MPERTTSPRIGIALGGGGARGLAHIVVLEAFDELGIAPARIAGSSIGAMVGAAYASGIPAKDIRDHALAALKSRRGALRRLISESGPTVFTLLNPQRASFALLDGEMLLDVFWPVGIARKFEELKIPLTVSTTDYYARKERVFDQGLLRDAVSASIALPGLMSPRRIDGRVLFDGGIMNPLPSNHLTDVDITIGIDVTGGPIENGDIIPAVGDMFFRSLQLMQHAITEGQLALRPLDILIRPAVDSYRVLDFFKVKEIVPAAEPAKDELKRKLEAVLNAAI